MRTYMYIYIQNVYETYTRFISFLYVCMYTNISLSPQSGRETEAYIPRSSFESPKFRESKREHEKAIDSEVIAMD